MSRRRHDAYDDDYYDDGYGDYEEEEEEEEGEGTAQYSWNHTQAEDQAAEASQAELLDALAEEFRACLGDASIPRDQVDAVLVAADYDVDSAILIMRQQMSAAAAASKESASQLAASEPSPIARMLESEPADHDVPELPSAASAAEQPAHAFAFDEPSPDDVVQSRKNAGRARVQAISSAQAAKPGALAKKPQIGSTRREGPVPTGTGKKGAAVADAAPGKGRAHSETAVPVAAPAPSQHVGKLKIASCSDLAARYPSVSIVVAGHVDAGKVRVPFCPRQSCL